jgi:hypothetical protein
MQMKKSAKIALLTKAFEAEDIFPGCLGNPASAASRWGLELGAARAANHVARRRNGRSRGKTKKPSVSVVQKALNGRRVFRIRLKKGEIVVRSLAKTKGAPSDESTLQTTPYGRRSAKLSEKRNHRGRTRRFSAVSSKAG